MRRHAFQRACGHAFQHALKHAFQQALQHASGHLLCTHRRKRREQKGREGEGRAREGMEGRGGRAAQAKKQHNCMEVLGNDCGQEEQHVIRVRRDGEVAALAGTRQRTTQEPAANHTRRHKTKKHTRQHKTAHYPLALERFSFP